MNRCFNYFSEIQYKMETNAVYVIVYYMRRFKARRDLERKLEEEKAKKTKQMPKKS